MRIECDPGKNAKNLAKHGISLEDAERLWQGSHIIIPAKNVNDEARYFIIGRIQTRIYVAIFTFREGAARVISCHRADKKLERYYHEKIK